jgi:hypothetical protein
MEEYYTGCQHSTPFVMNGPKQILVFRNTILMLLLSLFAGIPPSALLSCHKKTVAISFLADVCLNFFGLFGECMCIHCFGYSLVSKIHK